MSALGALQQIKDIMKEKEEWEAKRDRPKTKWLSLKGGQKVTVSFLQELDESGTGYSEAAGTAKVVYRHANPDNFKKSSGCTKDDDGTKCFGCERNAEFPGKGWKRKPELLINVLVEDGKSDPYVAVLAQKITTQSMVPLLTDLNDMDGSITEAKYQLGKVGSGASSSWTLIKKSGTTGANLDGLELYDLDKVTFVLPYEKQEEFYGEWRDEDDNSDVHEVQKASSEVEW